MFIYGYEWSLMDDDDDDDDDPHIVIIRRNYQTYQGDMKIYCIQILFYYQRTIFKAATSATKRWTSHDVALHAVRSFKRKVLGLRVILGLVVLR